MIYYHGTNEYAWALILQEGYLHGDRKEQSVFLTKYPEIALEYGDVLLEVDLEEKLCSYDTVEIKKPIPLDRVRRIERDHSQENVYQVCLNI